MVSDGCFMISHNQRHVDMLRFACCHMLCLGTCNNSWTMLSCRVFSSMCIDATNPGYEEVISSIPPSSLPIHDTPMSILEGEHQESMMTPSQEGITSPLLPSVKFISPSFIPTMETPEEKHAREIREMIVARQERAKTVI